MQRSGIHKLVRSGSKRRLRRLSGVEMEVISPEDNNIFVKCRRCDDGRVHKLRRENLVSKVDQDSKEKRLEEEQQALARYRQELLDLENLIPWPRVTKNWKGKRNTWRKRIDASSNLQDIGDGLKELLRCLVWGREYKIMHCPFQWESEIDEICNEGSDFDEFSKLWKKLSLEIRQWIQDRSQSGGIHFISHGFSRRTALLAFYRLKEAVAKGDDALNQVPLTDIINHDPMALTYLKEMLVSEKGKNVSPSTPVIKKLKQEPS